MEDNKPKTESEILEDKFEAERKTFSIKIKEIINKSHRISDIADCQVEMLSYRHMLSDKYIVYKNYNNRILAKDNLFFKERTEFYKKQYDLRLDYKEMVKFIDADMKDRKNITDLIQSHIEYIKDSMGILDSLSYTIKNRIEIEKINKGMF